MRLLPEDVVEGLSFQGSGATDAARAYQPDAVGAEDAELEDDDGDVEDAAEDVEFVLRDWWWVLVRYLIGDWGFGGVELGAGEHTECHEGEEGAEKVDEDEPEAYADDAAAALPHLVVGWEEADGDEEGGDDADDYHGVVDAAVVEGLVGG